MEYITPDALNDVLTKLRIVRDRYAGGYTIGNNVTVGSQITASYFNQISTWCNYVTSRSPIPQSFNTVTIGEYVTKAKITDSSTKLNTIIACYSNCHSNCYSNCRGSSSCGNSR